MEKRNLCDKIRLAIPKCYCVATVRAIVHDRLGLRVRTEYAEPRDDLEVPVAHRGNDDLRRM